jgi:pilus assembly protein CpaE
MNESKLHIKIKVKNPMAIKCVNAVIKEDTQLEAFDLKNNDPLDLAIYELNGTDPKILTTIENLLKSKKVGEVFLMSENPDTNLLMKLMRIGVKEFLPLPLDTQEFKLAMDRFKKRSSVSVATPLKKNGRIISILGSKGGVGTTTVAVNLAVALATSSKSSSVVLFDMNTLFGEIPLFLDLTPKFHWGEITKNIERLDDVFLMNILSKHSSGVHLLPSPSYLNANNSPSVKDMDRLLRLTPTLFDYVIVDAGQLMGDFNFRTFQHSHDVILVSLLNMPCLSNTNRLIKSLTELGYVSNDRLKVIINRNLKKNEITLKDAESGIEKEIFCVIPNDYRTTMTAINQGKPIHQVAPKSPIAKTFEEMTEKFLSQPETEKKRKWVFF